LTYYIISKDDCHWCDEAIKLLEGETVEVFHFNQHPMLLKLMDHAKLRTVPQIWVNDHYIGGYQELVKHTRHVGVA
jgi:glutaredoxin